jgi:hypothetical protein
MRAVRRFVRLITWQRLELGGDLPHAYAVRQPTPCDEVHTDVPMVQPRLGWGHLAD